jgi:hypothetical protein
MNEEPQEALDYFTPVPPQRSEMTQSARILSAIAIFGLSCLVGGIAFAVELGFLFAVSGEGQGSYAPLFILAPFLPFSVIGMLGPNAIPVALVFGSSLAQIPVYGLILAIALLVRKFRVGLLVVLGTHVIAVLFALFALWMKI